MRQLVIIGSGGFAQEAVWVAESMNEALPSADHWQILGYLDDKNERLGQELYGFKVVGKVEAAGMSGDVWYYCAIGKNATREVITARVDSFGWKAATLIHPNVVRAKYTEVGEGSYVGPGCILSPNATVGRHVIINQRVSIGHDAILGDFSQACPGAQINGSCRVGKGALVGSNASILQGKTVGEYAVVGANSQVVTHVRPKSTVAGVPALQVAAPRE